MPVNSKLATKCCLELFYNTVKSAKILFLQTNSGIFVTLTLVVAGKLAFRDLFCTEVESVASFNGRRTQVFTKHVNK